MQSLNHGIGFNTAAIELLLPTYGEQLGLKGKICKHWTLNPHPTLIPAIESGWVESVHCFGGELGMEEYIRARPDVFFTGADGSMRSNRAFCQLAGQYAVDMFIGSTLQVDGYANSSTVTRGRLSGFGGAPNMGHDPHGRRHATPARLNMITEPDPMQRGKKLVVQMVETFRAGVKPTFVEKLDAVDVAKASGMPLAPVMIYGDDVTHVLTEERDCLPLPGKRSGRASRHGRRRGGYHRYRSGRGCQTRGGTAPERQGRVPGRHGDSPYRCHPLSAGGGQRG